MQWWRILVKLNKSYQILNCLKFNNLLLKDKLCMRCNRYLRLYHKILGDSSNKKGQGYLNQGGQEEQVIQRKSH
jgi:hypothetical protein